MQLEKEDPTLDMARHYAVHGTYQENGEVFVEKTSKKVWVVTSQTDHGVASYKYKIHYHHGDLMVSHQSLRSSVGM